MARLLNKLGFSHLLSEMRARFVKSNEHIILTPPIVKVTPNNDKIVLTEVYSNQYIIIENTVNNIKVNNIGKKLEEIGKNKLFIQFVTGSDKLDITFDDIILWKDGKPIELSGDRLYRIEITECMGIWIGEWHSWEK